jgi:hypothetical protein
MVADEGSRAMLHAIAEVRTERGERGVPARIARSAADITARRFAGEPASRSRVRAYYWAVVRRRALTDRAGGAGLRSRYLATALADDLFAGGHGRQSVLEELRVRFGTHLPEVTLQQLSVAGGPGGRS